MDIAIPLYDGFTALDAVGPYDVLSRIPGARVKFVAVEPGRKRTENDMLSMIAEFALVFSIFAVNCTRLYHQAPSFHETTDSVPDHSILDSEGAVPGENPTLLLRRPL